MSVDVSDKIILNGVDVVNINELSKSQNRALLKFIEANKDLLSYSERPESVADRSNYMYGSNAGLNNNSGYGSIGSGMNYAETCPTFNSSYTAPYDKGYGNPQKRKEVSWSDAIDSLALQNPQQRPRSTVGTGDYYQGGNRDKQDRSRSYSPTAAHSLLKNKNLKQPSNMSGYYGSQQNIPQTPQSMYARDRTISPHTNYGALINHDTKTSAGHPAQYETTSIIHDRRSLTPNRKTQKDYEDSRFGGFGDRVGSGVDLSKTTWHGGEIITDPTGVPKGIKPKRMFYSPIGDGTVAADGIEMKKGPADLTPKVEIIHQRTVERKGGDGRGGVKIYEKEWTEGGGGGGASNINSRLSSEAPFPTNLGSNLGNAGNAGNAPNDDPFGSLGNLVPSRSNNASPYNNVNNRNNNASPYGANKSYQPSEPIYPSGRDSTGSSMFGDSTRSRRFEIKTDYMITNPRELIHQYATTTPTAVLDVNDVNSSSKVTTKSSYSASSYREESSNYAPYAPYHSTNPSLTGPKKFVQQLRDDNLTSSQKEANTHLTPLTDSSVQGQQRINEIKKETITKSSGNFNDVDQLTNRMMQELQTGYSTVPRY
uniref:ZM domain-containing protein n=1 Tax=Rhabditophanes sp. KR3021 TaxID=114890 RepID=A0AC35TV30_9BILA